ARKGSLAGFCPCGDVWSRYLPGTRAGDRDGSTHRATDRTNHHSSGCGFRVAAGGRFAQHAWSGVRSPRRASRKTVGGARLKMAAALKLQPLNTADGTALRFASFAEAGEQWLEFANQVQGATLYHGRSWLNLLRAAYGIDVQIAMLEHRSEPVAGCLFARPGRPFARRFVSLPDSELCTPLARDSEAADSLLQALAAHPVTRAGFEIRGVDAAPQPWQTVDVFAQWSIDLQQSVEKLHKALDRDVRRNM